jgi:AraC-like DNA-binding protein
MKFEVILPAPILRNHVQYFWKADVVSTTPHDFSIKSFADESTGLIVQHCNGKSSIFNTHLNQRIPEAFVYGMTTVPMHSQSRSPFSAIGVVFYPHAIQELLGVTTIDFTDHLVPLADMGLTNLSHELIYEPDPKSQLKILSDFLSRRVLLARQPDYPIRHAVQLIRSNKGQVRVQDLYKLSSVSPRQFERRFLNCTGVSSRHFIQVSRFQEFIRRIRSGDVKTLSEHAHDLGYADQSHFNRTIKRFTGLNPKAFRQYAKDGFLNLLAQ